MTITEYEVSGLTCGGCVNRVKSTLIDYADRVEVSLAPPKATLYQPKASISALNEALAAVGNYQLAPVATQAPIIEPSKVTQPTKVQGWLATYKPLLLVFAFILLATITVEVAYGDFVLSRWMPHFMAGFFLVFSFFKLLDLKGFADSYAMYDLLAKRVTAYAYAYPFIELSLGIWYLLGWQTTTLNWITLVVMGFSTIGVVLAVTKKQTIHCACLGTGFNLPMSTVTIVEDLTMVAMAAWMLLP